MPAQRLRVRHTTVYRYRRPVEFEEHRIFCRPRDSHDQRLVEARLMVTPAARIRQSHDVFSNSIAVASFWEPAAELRFDCDIIVDKFPQDESVAETIDPLARMAPFTYPPDEMADLSRAIERHYPDPNRVVDQWARGFLKDGVTRDTLELLHDMTCGVKAAFDYRERHEYGVLSPVDLMERGQGTCRDYALFLMEALRSLGFAARFVSGYLYDPSVDAAGEQVVGAGATHAWATVYVPGAGWIELDPTNGQFGNQNLIRVAVSRDPAQAPPLAGAFRGDPNDFIDMTVSVDVHQTGEIPQRSANQNARAV